MEQEPKSNMSRIEWPLLKEWFMVFLPTSRFTNILFASIISNVLGQFPYSLLPDLWLKEQDLNMCRTSLCHGRKNEAYAWQCLFCFLNETTKDVRKQNIGETTLRQNNQSPKGRWSADAYAQAIRYRFLADLYITRYATHAAFNQIW